MKENKKNLIFIHLSALLFGFSGLIGKYLLMPAAVISFGRGLLSAIFLFFLLKMMKETIRLDSKKDYLMVLLAGVLLAVNWITFIYSIQISTVAIGTLTSAACPLYLTFIEPYLFREKVKGISVISALIMLVGVLLIVPSFELGNTETQGIIWGMLASLAYALFSLVNRDLTKKYSGIKIAFFEQGTVALLLVPALFLFQFTFTVQDAGFLVIAGIFMTALPHVLFITGQKSVSAQAGGVIAGLEAVYGVALAALLLSEIPTVKMVIGGGVILGAALLSTMFTAKTAKSERLPHQEPAASLEQTALHPVQCVSRCSEQHV